MAVNPVNRKNVDRTKLFTNCNIVDVSSGQLIKNATIATKGSVIESVLVQFEPPQVTDCLVIDMAGDWALPGLIDLHVHVCDDPTTSFDESLNARAATTASKNLQQALAHGITTLRDMGSSDAVSIEIKRALENKTIPGPRLKTCGYVITYPGGHLHERGIQVRGLSQVKAAISRNIEIGADFIKAASDPEDDEAKGRFPDPTFTAEELSFLVSCAREFEIKVACHTFPSNAGINSAITAGVDTIEHAVPLNEVALRAAQIRKTIFVPTLVSAYDMLSREYVGERLGLDPEEAVKLDSLNGAHEFNSVPLSVKTWFDRLTQNMHMAISNGIQLGIGSDAGCEGTNFSSAIREMFLLTHFGASNLDVLRYATIVGAEALGLKNLGQIKPGYLADFVFMSGDPTQTLDALLDMSLIVSDGNIFRAQPQHPLQENYRRLEIATFDIDKEEQWVSI